MLLIVSGSLGNRGMKECSCIAKFISWILLLNTSQSTRPRFAVPCSGSGVRASPSPENPNPKGPAVAIVRNRGKNARNVSQKIWLSSDEAERVKVAAGDVPVATWLRDLALGQPSKPRPPLMQRRARERAPENAACIQPLAMAVARVGNNLNQIARAVNIDLKERNPMDAVLVATQLAQIRHELREELRALNEKFWREAKGAGEDPETR